MCIMLHVLCQLHTIYTVHVSQDFASSVVLLVLLLLLAVGIVGDVDGDVTHGAGASTYGS
jgi:hypothetical protein